MLKLIHRLLAEPLTKNKDIDDPETTIIRKQIIQKNGQCLRLSRFSSRILK